MDRQKLLQIIINLVSNATKFTDINGTIIVIFQTVSDNILKVCVKDNGIGISQKDQCKLFNTFVQVQSSTYNGMGSGLGLAISKKLVDILGGDISVKSSPGEGSEFIFTVKYDPYEDYKDVVKENSRILAGKTILVVDDNADNRIMLSELLFEWKMLPVMCASALEAFRMITGNRYTFDLGLIDICMPGTSGVELAAQIKEERPFFPLIALSSLGTFISSTDFERKLEKPVDNLQLLDAIYHVISKKQELSVYLTDNDLSDSSYTKSPGSQELKEMKFLIAEDVAYNRVMLVNILETLGYTDVTAVEDGEVAVKAIKNSYDLGTPYDIILLDLRMPVMDGFEVVEALSDLPYDLPTIIVLTASVGESEREECRNAGIEYFITKPIEIPQLKKLLLRVIDSIRSDS